MTDKTIDHRLAWLAGIIDGEGCVTFGLEVQSGSSNPSRRYIAAKWSVEVCNTDAAMLNEIMAVSEILGAKYKYYDRCEDKRRNRKPQGRVSFQTIASCRTVLVALLPYLVTKRSRAELMLRAMAHRASQPHPRRPGYVKAGDDQPFMQMFASIREMNRRGTAPVREDEKCPE